MKEEEDKLNWVNVINFLEVYLQTHRKNTHRTVYNKNNGNYKKVETLNQRIDSL